MSSYYEIDIDGQTIHLLALRSNWAKKGARITIRCRDRLSESEAGRETRARAASLPDITLTEDLVGEGEDANSIQEWLAEMGSDRIALPLWWDAIEAGNYSDRIFDAPFWWDFESEAVLLDSEIAALDSATPIAPLLIGLRSDRPKTKTGSAKIGLVTVTIDQDGPADWAVAPRSWTGDVDTWPSELEPNRSRVIHLSDDGLQIEEAGQGPERARRDGGKPMRWGQDATFVLDGREAIRTALGFFVAVWGRVGAYDVPNWYTPHDVATPLTPDGYRARLSSDELDLQFLKRGDVAKTQLRFWQLPWELNPPDNSPTVVPATAYLFEFAYMVPVGGPIYYRYTDWGIERTRGGDSFTPALIEPGKITESTEWGKSEIDVETFWTEGNPLKREWLGRVSAPLILTVWECNPDDVDGTATVVAKGAVRAPERTRMGFTCTAGDGADYDVPRRPVSRHDYRAAYSPESFLNEDDQRRVGTVSSVYNSDVRIDWTDGKGNPTAGDLQGGLIERSSGETYEVREMVGHWITSFHPTMAWVRLDDAFDWVEVGDTVHVYPAFDGSWAQLKARFPAFKDEMRGFPYLPVRTPSAASNASGISGKGGGK